MINTEFKKKKMNLATNLKNGKVRQTTSNKRETFFTSKFLNQSDRTNF